MYRHSNRPTEYQGLSWGSLTSCEKSEEQKTLLYRCPFLYIPPKTHACTPFETPYVVRLQNRAELADPKSVFTFTHPNWGPIDNTRYKVLQFDVKENCILHGFAGYFDSILYKDCTLSILPQTHSPGMFSWFPLFFPIKDPMFLPSNCQIEVHFWRNANKKSVWYEWCVTKPSSSVIHNPNGRSYTIGL